MRLKIDRNSLNILPEIILEEVFIEEVLHLHDTGDSIELVKMQDGSLRTVINME